MRRATKLTVLALVVLAMVALVRRRQEEPPRTQGKAVWPPLEPAGGAAASQDAPAREAPAREVPAERAWMPPLPDGSCPEGYPIKAKRSSGIYHPPGALAYARTFPDRCYPTPAAAEADGFRPAKR